MKASCGFVVSVMLAASAAQAQPAPHVRAIDAVSATAFARGMQESEHFRALVDALDASDVIVHVVATPALPGGVIAPCGSSPVSATRATCASIPRSLVPPDVRVSTLAHELQHACELAQSSAASDDAVRTLYRTIGQAVPGARDAFETDGAQRAGAHVWAELRQRWSSRTATTEQ